MTGAHFADQLASAGFDAADLSGKSRLFETALGGFSALTTTRPTHVWWVPGRLEAFGTHTDYAGGRTLVAALPRGFAVAAARRSDGQLHVFDSVNREQVVLDRSSKPFVGWRRYVQVAFERLERNFPGALGGANIAFASDLPRAAGMSSSSALVVAVVTALANLWGLHAHDRWQRYITSAEDLATFLASVESGRAFAGLEGDQGVGTHGGSEDHAAMLLARPRHVTAFSFLPLRRLKDAAVPDAWRFVVASSGVPSEKTGTAREPYNRLSRAATDLLDLWNVRHAPADSLAAALGSEAGASALLRESLGSSMLAASEREALHRRLEHFSAEDGLVLPAARAFEAAHAEALGDLSRESQRIAEELLRNQVPEAIALVRAAWNQGALAARSFGAGFGGSVWALVEQERGGEFGRRWLAEYQHTCPHASGASVFVAAPGPPLTELVL